jgi:hypothetical protein
LDVNVHLNFILLGLFDFTVPNLVLAFISQLKSHRDTYEGYVPMEYSDYLEKVSQYVVFFFNKILMLKADILELLVIWLIIFPCYT